MGEAIRMITSRGPTIDDFPGVGTSRLILVIYVLVILAAIAGAIWLIVRRSSQKKRRLKADPSARQDA
jgi:hypothetical protein